MPSSNPDRLTMHQTNSPTQAVVRIPGCLLMEERTLTGRLGLRPLGVPASWRAGAEEVGGGFDSGLQMSFICMYVFGRGKDGRRRRSILLTTTDLPGARSSLQTPPPKQILSLAASSSENNGPIVAVCGGKGTGKSTLTRYLTHRLLSLQRREPGQGQESEQAGELGHRLLSLQQGKERAGVVYLDLDLGQPEMTPPGAFCLVDGWWVWGMGCCPLILSLIKNSHTHAY